MKVRRLFKLFGWGLMIAAAGAMIYQMKRPLPRGLSLEGEQFQVPVESVSFYADRTWVDRESKRQTEQQIFDEVLRLVGRAEKYILVDVFLFNDWQGASPERHRDLAGQLTEALITRKRAVPTIGITVVTDPINRAYGGDRSVHLTRLEEAGVAVVMTDLTKLRDSNPLYSVWWRTFGQWWGNTTEPGWLPHPFAAEGQKITLRSWLSMLNFKANHRKLIVADQPLGDGRYGMATMVMSANPHNGSSAHGNTALKVNDKIWQTAIASEQAVGEFSGQTINGWTGAIADRPGLLTVQLLTEGAIRRRLVDLISQMNQGDGIDMAMFYLSERSVVKSLIEAAERGVSVRIILDPNRDAFGHTKNGIPNRPVARELTKKSGGKIQVKWCDTHGEQCHSKIAIIKLNKYHTILLGSANLTKRNIGDINLETDVIATAKSRFAAWEQAAEWFEEMWTNRDGRQYTVDYSVFAEESVLKAGLYRLQEATGLSSF